MSAGRLVSLAGWLAGWLARKAIFCEDGKASSEIRSRSVAAAARSVQDAETVD